MADSALYNIIRPTVLGIGGGGADVKIPTYREIRLDLGDRDVTIPLSGYSTQPALVGSAHLEYPLYQWRLGRLIPSFGIEGGMGKGSSFYTAFGSAYAKVALHFPTGLYWLDGRTGIAKIHTKNEGVTAENLAVDGALNVHIRLSEQANFCLTLGGRFGPITQVMGGLCLEGSLYSDTPDASADNLILGTQALKWAREELDKLQGIIATTEDRLKKAQATDEPVADKLIYLDQYITWMTDHNYSWGKVEEDIPTLNKALGTINAYITTARKALPNTNVWKYYEGEKLEEEIKNLNLKLVQPVLDILFFKPDSLFDGVRAVAKQVKDAVESKDRTTAQSFYAKYEDNLKKIRSMYNQIRSKVSEEQASKMADFESRLDCLMKDSQCRDVDKGLTAPSLKIAIDNLAAEKQKNPKPATTGGPL